MGNLLNSFRFGVAGPAFVPTDLASLVSWYEADDISTLWTDSARTTQVASDGDVVGAWDDKSGNGNHLLQATTAKKPTYQTDAGNTQNSLPTIRGDGTDDWIGAAFTLVQPEHVFIVTRTNAYSGGDSLFDGNAADGMRLFQSGVDDLDMRAAGSGGITVNDEATNGSFWLLDTLFNGASSHLQVAANTAVTGDVGSNDADGLKLFSVGSGSNPADMNIAEFIVCSAEITATDLSNLRTYLGDKWGVTA